jgi:hypothetical protein
MDILYFSTQKLHLTKLYIHICSGVCTTPEFRTKRGLLLKACTGDIPHIKFLVGCFALFVVSSNVDCYTFLWLQFISLEVRKVKSHVDHDMCILERVANLI